MKNCLSIASLVAFMAFSASPQVLARELPESLLAGFQRAFPGSGLPAFEKVAPEIYQFIVAGEVLYLSEDGRFLFSGMWDTVERKSLGESALRRFRRDTIASLGEDQILTYSPGKPRYTVNVFTDIDCGYCRKFHAHMPELQKAGVRVNYLLTPLRGEESHQKAVSVWCSEDRNRAMDRAKAGKRVHERNCDNPVEEHLRVSRLLGLRGTPLLVLENGTSVNGYLSPRELLSALAKDASLP